MGGHSSRIITQVPTLHNADVISATIADNFPGKVQILTDGFVDEFNGLHVLQFNTDSNTRNEHKNDLYWPDPTHQIYQYAIVTVNDGVANLREYNGPRGGPWNTNDLIKIMKAAASS